MPQIITVRVRTHGLFSNINAGIKISIFRNDLSYFYTDIIGISPHSNGKKVINIGREHLFQLIHGNFIVFCKASISAFFFIVCGIRLRILSLSLFLVVGLGEFLRIGFNFFTQTTDSCRRPRFFLCRIDILAIEQFRQGFGKGLTILHLVHINVNTHIRFRTGEYITVSIVNDTTTRLQFNRTGNIILRPFRIGFPLNNLHIKEPPN